MGKFQTDTCPRSRYHTLLYDNYILSISTETVSPTLMRKKLEVGIGKAKNFLSLPDYIPTAAIRKIINYFFHLISAIEAENLVYSSITVLYGSESLFHWFQSGKMCIFYGKLVPPHF